MYRKAKEQQQEEERRSTAASNSEQTVSSSREHCGCSKNKIDPKSVDEEKRNFLHIAIIECGDNQCLVNHIIQEGCDVSARDRFGKTPLHYAVQKQYAGYVERLVASGSDINVLSQEGWSPLMIACKIGRLDIVKTLVEHGAKLNLKNVRGEVAAQCAASAGNAEILEYLLNNKANVNYTNEKGTTPLILASKSSNLKAVDIVLKYKPRINHVDGEGRTALHYCIENGAATNTVSNVQSLINAGADLDIQDNTGDAPFILAIKYNHTEALKCLVEARCDLTAVDGLNGTAVVLAAMMGRNECVRILLEAGEDPDDRGFAGFTPLCTAAYSNNLDLMKMLVEKGKANVNFNSRCGAWPVNVCLMRVTCANAKMQHKLLAYLIQHGADVNLRIESVNYFTGVTSGRNCALSFAITSGYVSLVRMLLTAGTKVAADECHHWKEHADNVFMGTVDSERLLGEIMDWASKPHKLKNLCRLSIRKGLGHEGIFETVKRLPLPGVLKGYLNYEELDRIMPETSIKCQSYQPLKGVLSPCFLAVMSSQGHPMDKFTMQTY